MDPFVGQIAIFAFPFAPQGWALCDGSVLNIQQNVALNSLIGKTYGGNGTTTFGLPDLRGRVPVHRDNAQKDYIQGTMGGVESVTLTAANVPVHTHQFNATTVNTTGVDYKKLPNPSGATIFTTAGQNLYVTPQSGGGDLVSMDSRTCSSYGSGAAHVNMQPSLVLNFVIATVGLYPPRD